MGLREILGKKYEEVGARFSVRRSKRNTALLLNSGAATQGQLDYWAHHPHIHELARQYDLLMNEDKETEARALMAQLNTVQMAAFTGIFVRRFEENQKIILNPANPPQLDTTFPKA